MNLVLICMFVGSAKQLCIILWWNTTKLVINVWIRVQPDTVC